jgi:hypothetical protein
VPDEEVHLGNAILKQMQSHVAGLGELGFHRPVGDADGDLVVSVYDRWGLGVAEVGKRLPFHSGDLGGTERAGQFHFLDRRADDRDPGAGDGEGGVDERGSAAKVVEVAAHAASIWTRQVGGIRHEYESHAGGPKDFGSLAVGGEVAEKTAEVAHGVLSGGGLGAG